MRPIPNTPDRIELLVSEKDDGLDPEISIVVPALNEEITIKEFVEWCWEGLRLAGASGEVIIVDSSSDLTPKIALEGGARVLRTPKRGLGQAYLDAIPYIRGNFIVMGDCDLTYDFRKIKDFIESYKAGNDYVMGSRFKGVIEAGAMPSLHRYFGTPLTTWILNKIYKSKFTDIHCGMRGLTKDALLKINLTSQGWEYASEMVLKATRVGLKIDEVPVTFYKDREGRLSHHRRSGFWSPWVAGWINLKVMLVYSPDSFLIKPGIVFFILGFLLAILSLGGEIKIGPVNFGLYVELLGVTFSILGYSLFQTGIFSRNIHGLRAGVKNYINDYISYNAGMVISCIMIGAGLALDLHFLLDYISNHFSLHDYSRIAVFGLLLIILGVQTITFTLMLELGRRVGLRGVHNAV
ncbi:glycosyltransferase family 2 protein [Polynucleobacter rarus]|uniref:glycosyltransferase family 2 protein n=1 Tax=Polynucleobacter rarus TaxID=556055 RepID=UPI000D3E7D13|nr:glycosyltransferase family 2 protein [Polynucleobacter rarus]